MKAVLFRQKNELLRVTEVDRPYPKSGEVLIRLDYAALNHRDLLIAKEQTLENPVIAGSDGSGRVHGVGEGVDISWMDKQVIINPALYWGPDPNKYADNFQILGNPTHGTFAEYTVVPQEYVYEKPVYLSSAKAAALPLAALTAYRVLFTKARLKPADTVLITGIGGGAALYVLQMAVASGSSVYVTSSSPEKIQKAIELGAKGGFNYRDPHWVDHAKSDAGGFDVIVDSAGGNGFAQLTEIASPAARIVVFGRTAGNINGLKPGIIFNKQLHIMGSTMGTQEEFRAMLDFYGHHQLRPVLYKVFPLSSAAEAFECMENASHFGKILLQIKE